MDKDTKVNKREKKKKQTILEYELNDIKSSMKMISSKVPTIGGPKGKIKLDPDNENHRDWYEDD